MLGVVPESLVGYSPFQTLKSLGGMFPVNMAGVALREIMCLWAKFEAKLLRVPRVVPRPDPPTASSADPNVPSDAAGSDGDPPSLSRHLRKRPLTRERPHCTWRRLV